MDSNMDADSDSSYDPPSSSSSSPLSPSQGSLPQRGRRMRLWVRPDYTTLQIQWSSNPYLFPLSVQHKEESHSVKQDRQDREDCFDADGGGHEPIMNDDNDDHEGVGVDVGTSLIENNKNESIESVHPQQQQQQPQHSLQSSNSSSASEIEWPRSNLTEPEDGSPRNNTATSAVGSIFSSSAPPGCLEEEEEEEEGPSPLRPSRALRAAPRGGGRWAVGGFNAKGAAGGREQQTQAERQEQTTLPPTVMTKSSPLSRTTTPGKRTPARHRPTTTTAENNIEPLIPTPIFQITTETQPYHTLAAASRQDQIYTSRLRLDNTAARDFPHSNTRGAYTLTELREERIKQKLRRGLLAHVEKVAGRKNGRSRWIRAGLLEGIVSGLTVAGERVYQPPWRRPWDEKEEEEGEKKAREEEDRKRESAVWVLANLKDLERLKWEAKKKVARVVPSNDADNDSDHHDNNTQRTLTPKATPSRRKTKSQDRSQQKTRRSRILNGPREGLYVGMRQVDWTRFEDPEEDRPFTLPGLTGAYNTVQWQEYPEYLHQPMRPTEGV